jgi:hypothetical protein
LADARAQRVGKCRTTVQGRVRRRAPTGQRAREKGEAMQFGVFTTNQRKLSLIEWSSGAQAVG